MLLSLLMVYAANRTVEQHGVEACSISKVAMFGDVLELSNLRCVKDWVRYGSKGDNHIDRFVTMITTMGT